MMTAYQIMAVMLQLMIPACSVVLLAPACTVICKCNCCLPSCSRIRAQLGLRLLPVEKVTPLKPRSCHTARQRVRRD